MFRLRKLFVIFGLISFFCILFVSLNYHLNNQNNSKTLEEVLKSIESRKKPELNELLKCPHQDTAKSFKRRGSYWVFYNYIPALRKFECHESITLTTPGDFRFLDNVVPLVKRWNGPISVALYAPGDDLKITLEFIAYLRNCENSLVKELVTFHIFFDEAHFPQKADKPLIDLYEDNYNCSLPPPFVQIPPSSTYKSQNKLVYPINVARNVARETAQTYFIFPSDIELFPTPNFIEKFLKMVTNKYDYILVGNPKVFVLPIFEIKKDEIIPNNKTRLQEMIKEKSAILFHQKLCTICHKVLKGDEWLAAEETEGIDIFTIGKRQKKQVFWEPFYIGTHKEPLFDERLSWEGQSNKMSQAYSLCLLNYDFMILDNAFLTHKPGIKKHKEQVQKHQNIISSTTKILQKIKKELIALYGNNDKCKM